MLVLAPAVCCIAAVALSEAMGVLTASLKSAFARPSKQQLEQQAAGPAAEAEAEEADAAAEATPAKGGKAKGGKEERRADRKADRKAGGAKQGWKQYAINPMVALAGLAGIIFILGFYTVHCVWLSADGYSAPSIVMQTVRGCAGRRGRGRCLRTHERGAQRRAHTGQRTPALLLAGAHRGGS